MMKGSESFQRYFFTTEQGMIYIRESTSVQRVSVEQSYSVHDTENAEDMI